MNCRIFLLLIAFLVQTNLYSQILKEVTPPYNIKTVSFSRNQENVIPVFAMGDVFQFTFDDLYGDEANYYYTIIHCDYDWKKSDLSRSEYLDGFDEQRIQNYLNSFNTLQIYSHYKLTLPNRQAKIKVSGNYMLQIINENKEIVFSRKFIIYENLVSVPTTVKRSRTMGNIQMKQNLEFSITSKNLQFQNPLQNVKVMLMQNGKFDQVITNVKPMYTLGNDLIYKYDQETQFWGGNEYYYFDNKDIRAANNNIARVDAKDIYNTYLYRNEARKNKLYTYFPDVNGNFVVRLLNSEKPATEADYSWVYFTLSVPDYFGNDAIYIGGMFNNYVQTPEYKMDFNADRNVYEKALLIKQGFTNYEYYIADKKGNVDYKNAPDGNFYQTENNYLILVYYRENGQRYDRVIGKGGANSENITN